MKSSTSRKVPPASGILYVAHIIQLMEKNIYEAADNILLGHCKDGATANLETIKKLLDELREHMCR